MRSKELLHVWELQKRLVLAMGRFKRRHGLQHLMSVQFMERMWRYVMIHKFGLSVMSNVQIDLARLA